MSLMRKWTNEYYEIEGDRYKSYINKFIDFIENVSKGEKPNSITIFDIELFLKELVENETIKAETTMALYLESLKSLYAYFMKTGKCSDIFAQRDYTEFKMSLFEKYGLKKKKQRDVYSADTIKEILRELDQYLEQDFDLLVSKQA